MHQSCLRFVVATTAWGNRLLVVATLLGGLTTACATAQPYKSRHRYIPASKTELLAAAVSISKDQRWAVLEVDASGGRVEALSPVEDLVGVATRQRWSFRAHDGVAYAQLVFEARFNNYAGAPWARADGVCPGYEYRREDEQLDKLTRRVWDVKVASAITRH